MGFFDKKYCDVCGEKIGLLGNRKLDDGNLCKNCAKKLSPFFEDRRKSTVEEIKKQLEYREANKEKVEQFSVTREYETSGRHVFIDDNRGWVAFARKMDTEENPDIINLSQIKNARLDIDENRAEEKYRDEDGEEKSYFPPRYKYSYDYRVIVDIDSPWFDDVMMSMTTFRIDDNERGKMLRTEESAKEIIEALRDGARNAGGSMGMANDNQYHRPSQQTQQTETQNKNWFCPNCGGENEGKFCQNCGTPRPQLRVAKCGNCGWEPENPNEVPKFCPNCGNRF